MSSPASDRSEQSATGTGEADPPSDDRDGADAVDADVDDASSVQVNLPRQRPDEDYEHL